MPCLKKLSVEPTLFVMAPPKLVLLASPTRNCMAPDVAELVMRPPVDTLSPAREATVELKPPRSSVPPESTESAVVSGSEPRAPSLSRPPFTTVAPA